jgi:hypothetical protein
MSFKKFLVKLSKLFSSFFILIIQFKLNTLWYEQNTVDPKNTNYFWLKSFIYGVFSVNTIQKNKNKFRQFLNTVSIPLDMSRL